MIAMARLVLRSGAIQAQDRRISALIAVAVVLVLVLALPACQKGGATRPPSEAAPTSQMQGPSAASTSRLDLRGQERERARKRLGLSESEITTAIALQPIIARAALEHRLDPNLLNAIILHESRFNPDARNPSGAKGLMQLMPKTSRNMAKKLNRRNRPYDPDFSIHAGAMLLATLRDKVGGSTDLMLFGFAQGSGRVRAWKKKGGPYPARVKAFIKKVRGHQAAFKQFGFPGRQP